MPEDDLSPKNERPNECFPSLRDTGWDNPCYPVQVQTYINQANGLGF
ncbi:MAG: hypothetical protein KDA52_17595 [Planctomycetaceae bacterium]|nr:hypothetical protein [Planctomycetaceae bacterium]